MKPGLQLVDTPDFPAAWKPAALAHREAIEVYRKAGFAEFDWTAVSPSAVIEPGTRTGHYRTATDQLLRTGTLTDDTLSTMLDTFGPVVTRKYIITISWFSMLSLFLNATRTPLETTDKIGRRTSPLG